MNHSVVRFRNALVYLSNGTSLTMSSEAPERILMTLDGTNLGQLLGYPDSLDLADSNFSEHWNACD